MNTNENRNLRAESLSDEKMCAGMSASYLQGYKYSRPVPIENLTEYLQKR